MNGAGGGRKIFNKKYLIWFFTWSNEKRWILLISAIILFLYLILHEYIHYWTALYLGYSGEINWGFAFSYFHLDNLQSIPFKYYFLIVLMPYIIDISLLIILFILNWSMPKHKNIFAKLAFFPFLDILWNYLFMLPTYFTNQSDDFLNIIRLGALQNEEIFIKVSAFVILLLLISIYLFQSFYLTIWNLLKLGKLKNCKNNHL